MKRARGESGLFTACVTAEGTFREVGRISDFSALPKPKQNKRLSPPAIESDNKLSTSKM